METKFTKGQWIVKEVFPYSIYNLDIKSMGLDSITNEESEANAKLISCAPEMFEKLLNLIQSGLEIDSEHRTVIRIEEEEVKEIWELIKKATQ